MSNTEIQFRRGTTAKNEAFTGAEGEITYDTETKELISHDGGTPGGERMAKKKDVAINVSTVADAKALNAPVGAVIETQGENNKEDGGWKRYEVVAGGSGVNSDLFVDMNNGNQLRLVSGRFLSDISIRIPTDYPDMQTAIDDLFGRVFFTATRGVYLVIESGYVITNTLTLNRNNYKNFTIISEDEVVYCSLPNSDDDLFRCWNFCDFTTIATLFDMQGTGRHGLFLANGGRAYIPPSSVKTHGIRNAGQRNVYSYRGSWASIGSKLRSSDIPFDFSGAGTDNLFSQRGSWIFASNCTLKDAGEYGAHCRHGSQLVVNECDITNAGLLSLEATAGGFISAFGSQIDPGSWSVTPNMISSPSGIILTDQAPQRGLGTLDKSGDEQEGYITYSDGSKKFWKYIEVDSTTSDTQIFTMPLEIPDYAKIYLSGARSNVTSTVVGTDVTRRSEAAASVVYGRANGNGDLGVRVTNPSTLTENFLIGYMAVVEVTAT